MEKYKFQYFGKSVLFNSRDIAGEIGNEELALKTATLAKKL
jgi:hypothetical protein